MFSFDKSFYIYVFITVAFVLMALHFGRKMHNMKNHCRIMENKLKTLKRENSELQKALMEDSVEKTTMSDADIIMNQIFNVEPKDIPQMMQADIFVCSSDEGKCEILEINDDEQQPVVKNIVEEIIDDVVMMPPTEDIPVVKHEDVVPDVENESVVSEPSNVYNRKKLSKLNLEKLKEIASSMNLPTDGTKNSIIDRILSQ